MIIDVCCLNFNVRDVTIELCFEIFSCSRMNDGYEQGHMKLCVSNS